tara:strand:- start:1701 stop:2708 length:1008 start_codon:yes stop_codon:yes gene_type:complete
MFSKFKTLYDHFSDLKWLVSPNSKVHFSADIKKVVEEKYNTTDFQGFLLWLKNIKGIGKKAFNSEWAEIGNQLKVRTFENSLFADGKVFLYQPKDMKKLVVFLPGSKTGADEFFFKTKSPFYFKNNLSNSNVGFLVWDWPLQGQREKNSLFGDLKGLKNIESEYAKFLPVLGSSLWIEYVDEMRFILEGLAESERKHPNLSIIGWSQGAHFAWYCALMFERVNSITVVGSCSLYKHLIETGKTMVHGYSYYPLFREKFTDLDEIAKYLITIGSKVNLIYGQNDKGCLQKSVDAISRVSEDYGRSHMLDVINFKGLGHQFSGNIRERVIYEIEREN